MFSRTYTRPRFKTSYLQAHSHAYQPTHTSRLGNNKSCKLIFSNAADRHIYVHSSLRVCALFAFHEWYKQKKANRVEKQKKKKNENLYPFLGLHQTVNTLVHAYAYECNKVDFSHKIKASTNRKKNQNKFDYFQKKKHIFFISSS